VVGGNEIGHWVDDSNTKKKKTDPKGPERAQYCKNDEVNARKTQARKSS